jgi:hypothetical protein
MFNSSDNLHHHWDGFVNRARTEPAGAQLCA